MQLSHPLDILSDSGVWKYFHISKIAHTVSKVLYVTQVLQV